MCNNLKFKISDLSMILKSWPDLIPDFQSKKSRRYYMMINMAPRRERDKIFPKEKRRLNNHAY